MISCRCFQMYIYCHRRSINHINTMAPSTTYIEPVVIRPHAFPDPVSHPIPAIDPQLNSPSSRRIPRTSFSPEDLTRLVFVTAEEDPWAKPHGQITKTWNKVLEQLQSEGRFEMSSITTLQNKVNALIAWQEVCEIPFPVLRHRSYK